MRRALLDTSFVIALARGDEVALDDPPDEAAISAVTLCGLHHGVLVASERDRPGRLATLAYAERRFAVLPVDERVAPHYGRLVAATRRARRRRLGAADALIAATAAAHGLPLVTRDRDFERLEGVEVVLA
ncbi:MAG TPA: PIN domain-containing protein [Thermoleophilaceae bacterium]